MLQLKTPRTIFFDAGLVLLNPDGERLMKVVAALTGRTIAQQLLVDAYRFVIHRRDETFDISGFPFWETWCTCIGLDPRYAVQFESAIHELERDRQKLWTVLDSDVVPTLTELGRRGIGAGVISNADGELLEDLERAGIGTFLNPCIDSVVVASAKPSPEMFRIAVGRANATVEQCWMVGDDYLHDIQPSLELGFGASILFDPIGLHLTRPGVVRIRRLTDLLKLLDGVRDG
jgi:HAD superfamily hydrolase (TIGR01549 family)